MRRAGLITGCILLLLSGATSSVAGPPRPGTTDSGLNESEEATLWAKQSGETYISNEEYRAAYGKNRTTVHQVANGSDLTFTEPPATAKHWTHFAHGEYTPGGRDTSVYPPHATTKNSTYIKEAHATIFAISPSTKAYINASETRFYVAPDGHALGTVDYRLNVPPDRHGTDKSVTWELRDHEITEVRLYADDELLVKTDGTHRPELDFELDDDIETLRLEADINTTLKKTVETPREINRTLGNGTKTIRDVETGLVDDSVTVADEVEVDVYDLRAAAYYAEYPDGKIGVSIYQTEPWQGYSLTEDGSQRVRGVWRFFTARDTNWDELVRSTGSETERVDSNALPVYVHTYPSELGPRAKPEYDGPTIIETWGRTYESPAASIPENVSVEVINSTYEPTHRIAVESRYADPDALTVHGIVYGTEAAIIESSASPGEIRESELSATVVGENESGVTVLLELEHAETGAPIVLQDDNRRSPVADRDRDGYIEIADRQVKTNTTGEATVFITEPGTYTARYEPESWLSAYPSYAGDTDVVRWYPLTTINGWMGVLWRFGMLMLPFVAAIYAGRQLGELLHWRRF